jgi:phage shock protein B
MLLGLVVVVLFVALLVKLLGSGRAGATTEHQDETRMIQELYQGMGRMERRIEALETLLLDKEPPEHGPGKGPQGR